MTTGPVCVSFAPPISQSTDKMDIEEESDYEMMYYEQCELNKKLAEQVAELTAKCEKLKVDLEDAYVELIEAQENACGPT